jgi:Nif-specific regulatory protein
MINTDVNRLYSLIELASVLGQQADFQEVLRLITQKALTIVKCDYALIMMLNPRTHQTVKTIFAEGNESRNKKNHFLHTNITGWVINNNRAFLTRDIHSDKRFQKNLFKNLEIRSAICVPLRIETSIIGTLLLLSKTNQNIFSEVDLDILGKLADIASPFLRNVQIIEEFFIAPLPKQTLIRKYEVFGMLGKSKKFIELLQSIESASRSKVRILLEGESGTGKELVAKAIHKLSPRSQFKFLVLDCGTIPPGLIESELFGHVKGAFTGASTDHKGLLEEANGGTLFMDEINNLPLEMQSKFLRFLQEGEIRPLGSNQVRKVNVRIIAASSVVLRELVEKQQFREDLFYRLNVYPISIPSLNERREDIPLLANHYIRKFSKEQNKATESFHGFLLDFIRQRNWEGNIRELENFVERLITLAPVNIKILEPGILPLEFQKEWQKIKKTGQTASTSRSLGESLAEYEEKIIYNVLVECNWNQSKAARMLRISEHAIRYKIKKLGIKKII